MSVSQVQFAEDLFHLLKDQERFLTSPKVWVESCLETFQKVMNSTYGAIVESDIIDIETENEGGLVRKIVYLYPTVNKSVKALFTVEFTPGKEEVTFLAKDFNQSGHESKPITLKSEEDLAKHLNNWLKEKLQYIIPLIS